MKFELHCHSHHSKGAKIPWEGIPSPAAIVAHAKRIGLSGVAITDHHTTKAWPEARREAKKQGIIFIPGVELQTQSGHVIALGISEPVANFLSVEETVDRIREQGGVAVAAHPFDVRGQGIRSQADKADAIEMFNSLNIDKIGNLCTYSMFRHSPLPKVAGSDAHTLSMLGCSVNTMNADSVDGVLKCIRDGRVEFTGRYMPMEEVLNWARERLSRSQEYVMKYTAENYRQPKAWLYSKMLKKFLATSNAPWRVLAEISLSAVRCYGMAKAMMY
ncbi:MAG: CehA/McbA family metallohydrolase [Candidatus Aenigmarchaeota archaeon]|nr:CehA/McbA family metallohydrolase [Candidatus Aenigmarchaeota archaeon]